MSVSEEDQDLVFAAWFPLKINKLVKSLAQPANQQIDDIFIVDLVVSKQQLQRLLFSGISFDNTRKMSSESDYYPTCACLARGIIPKAHLSDPLIY